jgi:hypothetical protein
MVHILTPKDLGGCDLSRLEEYLEALDDDLEGTVRLATLGWEGYAGCNRGHTAGINLWFV